MYVKGHSRDKTWDVATMSGSLAFLDTIGKLA